MELTKSFTWHGLIAAVGAIGLVLAPGWALALPLSIAPATVTAVQPDPLAYVTNAGGNTVSVVDTATNSVVGSPIPVGTNPDGIAITPNGHTAYVANFGSDSVTPIDLTTSPPTAGTAIGVDVGPTAVAINPSGTSVFVLNGTTLSVSVISTATNTVTSTYSLLTYNQLTGLAVSVSGQSLYVTEDNPPNQGLGIINAATGTQSVELPAGVVPWGVSVLPTQQVAYVIDNELSNLIPVNVATGKDGKVTGVGPGNPDAVAVSPTGKLAYVVTGTNQVIRVTLATRAASSVSDSNQPVAVALTPDGRTAYVVDHFGFVTPVDTGTNTMGTPIALGTHPSAIAIAPDQAPVAAFTASPASAGSPTSFDASASSAYFGTIASYTWNFGDGTSNQTVTSPTTTHTYAKQGKYKVTLTVTDSDGTSRTQVFTGQTMSRNGGPTATTTRTIVLPALAYVTNGADGTVTLIDTLANRVVGSPVSVGTDPDGIAVTPNGNTAYVANHGDNTVRPIDLTTDPPTPGTAITVGAGPTHVFVNPTGTSVFVVNNSASSVSVINTVTNTVANTFSLPTGWRDATLSADGTAMYVTEDNGANQPTTGLAILSSSTGSESTFIAIPSSKIITPYFVGALPTGQVAVIQDFETGNITQVNVATHSIGSKHITGDGQANGLGVSPLGKLVYVLSAFADNGDVWQLNLATKTSSSFTTADTNPFAVAITRDGQTAYIVDQSLGEVTPVNVTTNTPATPIPVGSGASSGPSAIGFGPT